MNDFKTYYASKFRQDIGQFFSTIPDESRFHEDTRNKQLFSIQYGRLTPNSTHLKFLKKEEKELFGIALFFTVLTDMVCFAHFKSNYSAFKALTRYPKFIGNCPGGCHYHYHPSDIFAAMNKDLDILSDERLNFYDKFNESIETMEIETVEFFENHLPAVNGNEFWDKCKKEFPYRLKTEI